MKAARIVVACSVLLAGPTLGLAAPNTSLTASIRLPENEAFEMPAIKTGTGAHDFFNFGFRAGPKPATYSIAFSFAGKISLEDLVVLDPARNAYPMLGQGQRTFLLRKFTYVVVELSREQMERGMTSGSTFTVSSRKGKVAVAVPRTAFRSAIFDADKQDTHRARIERLEEEAREKAAAEAVALRKAKERQAARESFLANNPRLSKKIVAAFNDDTICVGMPRDGVELVMGKPSSRTVSGGAGRQLEYWHYVNAVILFEDGLLLRWSFDR